MDMNLKYTFLCLILFVFSACGAKTERNKNVGSEEAMGDTLPVASSSVLTAGRDTLPAYLDSYTGADSALVCRILHEAVRKRRQLSHEQLVLMIARKFIGVPYVAHTLDRNDEEKLVVNLHGLDCTTYVETVTALTRCAEKGETRFADYVRRLEQLRYRGGKISYVNRLHYFHWWLEDNSRMGFVTEINTPVPPFTAVQTLKINYMSQNARAYDMLKNRPERVAGLKRLEDASNGTNVRYISKTLLNDSRLLRKVIRDGDIIAIVTSKYNLDTTHLGFAVWHKDGIHLLNASSLKRNGCRVVEPAESFFHYMMSHPSSIGIRVARIK